MLPKIMSGATPTSVLCLGARRGEITLASIPRHLTETEFKVVVQAAPMNGQFRFFVEGPRHFA